MSTTSAYLVASNTGEKVTTPSAPPSQQQVPIFPPEHIVQAQAFYSPIHTAIYNPNLDLASIESMILSDPSCVHRVHPQNGYTPLHAAVRRTHIGMVKMIVEHGADVDARANEGETPLMVGCQVSMYMYMYTVTYCACIYPKIMSYGKGSTCMRMYMMYCVHYL